MDLWIRSQDRTKLVKADNISYMDIAEDYEKEVHSLWNDCKGILGTYKTKERALEVLDEINEIKYYKYMAQLDWNSFVTSVLNPKPIEEQQLLLSMMNTYVMPKE